MTFLNSPDCFEADFARYTETSMAAQMKFLSNRVNIRFHEVVSGSVLKYIMYAYFIYSWKIL